MQTMIVTVIFAGFLFSSTYGQDCSVCQLIGQYNQTNGYGCYPISGSGTTSVLCTCPISGVYEINGPCRLCGGVNPVCRPNGKLLQCLESNDCGTSYACLCEDPLKPGAPYLTLNADCDPTNILTCPAITGPTTGPSPCLNGGVLVDSICHCPSGYSGALCQLNTPATLCEPDRCKNNGRCAVHNPNGPYEAICRCRTGTWGDYCEMTGTAGFCSSSSCLNGGACLENVIGSTRFAYCKCAPGYNGTKCDSRYFTCTQTGLFRDADMHDQSRYFECKIVSGVLRAEYRTCPRGLRFNETKKLCTL